MNILQKIEKIIKEADTYFAEQDLLKKVCLETKISIWKFYDYLDVLESLGKIMREENGLGNVEIYWVGVDNPKLEKLLKESVRVR